MKRTLKIGLTALAAVSAIAAVGVAALGRHQSQLLRGAGVEKSITLDNDTLKTVALEDWEHTAGKADKKFTIPLANDCFILGAIIFNDCGLQSTGSSLGDPFGIDNSGSEDANAYNFNVLFSFEGNVGMKATFDVTSNSNNSSEEYCVQLKYANLDGADFYNNLKTISYNNLVKIPSSGGFYDNGSYKNTHKAVNMLSLTDSIEYSASGFNLMGFQFTYYESKFIQAGHKLSCMFKELKFTYTCN